jgi:endonuclease YncB( thermonuclease family)
MRDDELEISVTISVRARIWEDDEGVWRYDGCLIPNEEEVEEALIRAGYARRDKSKPKGIAIDPDKAMASGRKVAW